MTGRELWRARVEQSTESPFLIHEGRTWTFGEADAKMLSIAGGLAALGVRVGTRVAVGMPNSADTLLVQAALRELGAVLVPLLPGLTFDELEYQVRHSASRVLIVADPVASLLVPRLAELPAMEEIVEVSAGLDELSRNPIDPHRPTEVSDLTPWAIFYTSGSSGRPKGVMLPAGAFTSGGIGYADRFELTADDNFFLATTMAHAVGGLTAQCISLYAGCRLTIAERFRTTTFWSEVEQSRATATILFPAHLNLLLQSDSGAPASGDSPLRLVITHSWVEAFRRRFGVEVALCWGMTETGGGCTGTLPGYRGRDGDGYVGLAMDGFEVAIKEGEICVRNRHRMLEYLADPDATRRVLIDGWIHSGDRGRLDAEGGLWFEGRIKNVIKRSGENISPEEVESALAAHHAVAECLVLGVPDPVRSEEVAAHVVLRAEVSAEAQELVEFARRRLAPWKLPRYVLVTRVPLPRLGSGKIDRQRVRREFEPGKSWDRGAAQRQAARPSKP